MRNQKDIEMITEFLEGEYYKNCMLDYGSV
jgi:hypothetical protein